MNIQLLADRPDVIPKLIIWYILEWEPYYGTQGPGDAKNDLDSRCNYKELPIGLVAMDDNQVCGTVTLGLDTTTNLSPSVIGLLVGREYRKKGIATALFDEAVNLARQHNYNQIYISTSILGDFLIRKGWHTIGDVEFLNTEKGSIYTLDL